VLALCFTLATWTCVQMPSGFQYHLATHTVTWTGATARHVDRLRYDLRAKTVTLDDPLVFRAGFE
jgi:hypothetical protein